MIKRIISKVIQIYGARTFRRKNRGIHTSVVLKNPDNIIIGDNCCIGENSYLLCWKQYSYKKINQSFESVLCIGDDFSATRHLTIQCCNRIMIGHDVLIASDVFICDYNHGMDPMSNSYRETELEVSTVEIGNGVWIGQGVYILPGTSIGDHSIIGAGSVVKGSIPSYSMAVGNPARVVKKFNFEMKVWESI